MAKTQPKTPIKRKRPVPGRPFKKGNPGGPGRPKTELSLTHLRNSILADQLRDKNFLQTYLTKFVRIATQNSKSWQAKMIAERILGPDILDQLDTVLQRKEREDQDFKSFRIYHSTHELQRRFIFGHEQEIQLMAGRRAGKTEGIGWMFAETIVRRPRARCLYIGKTITKAMDLLWQPIIHDVQELGYNVTEKSRVEGRIILGDEVEIHFGGNSNSEEREKQRGFQWDVVAIDECQSQAKLDYLIEDIIYPTLIDRKGKLVLAGTGPRVRGTHWDWRWSNVDRFRALRLNWSIAENPFIADYQTELARIREDKQLSETNPLYVREYLGQIAYDDDALVIRLGPANYFADEELAAWIAGQPVTDIRFEGGLDFGFEDADGFGVVCYSTSRPECWLIYEYKARRTGTDELVTAIRAGIDYVNTSPLFARVEQKRFSVYADTGGGGKKIGYDLALKGLPIQDAYKASKDLAIELMQDDTRMGMLKVRAGGPFDDEAMKTVFKRNEQDELTREVDDDTYHPDLMDAVTYAMRPIWMFTRRGGST